MLPGCVQHGDEGSLAGGPHPCLVQYDRPSPII